VSVQVNKSREQDCTLTVNDVSFVNRQVRTNGSDDSVVD